LIECEPVLVPMLPAAVVLQLAIQFPVLWVLVLLMLAIQFPVLAMLWALVLTIQRLVLVAMQLPFPLYRRQTLPSRQEWFAFFGVHFNTPMISLNRRLYSLPEYEAG
jgi:hypothetical protein